MTSFFKMQHFFHVFIICGSDQCIPFHIQMHPFLFSIYQVIWWMSSDIFQSDMGFPKHVFQLIVPTFMVVYTCFLENLNQCFISWLNQTISLWIIVGWLSHNNTIFSTKNCKLISNKKWVINCYELLKDVESG